jgi:hypothetical protein
VYGTLDDTMTALDASGTLSVASFGPGEALAGDGGAATVLLASGGDVLVATAGTNGTLGDADDHVLQIDVNATGAASIRGTLPVPGGLFAGARATRHSQAGPTRIDARFVCVLDRGADSIEGTSDDVLRVFRDRDGDGRFGTVSDDLNVDGLYDAADTVEISAADSDAASTAFAASADAHLFVLQPGVDGAPGGGDDVPLVLWLRESARLP